MPQKHGYQVSHCYRKIKNENQKCRMSKDQLNCKYRRPNSIPKHNRLNTRLVSNTMRFRLGIIFGRIRTSHVTNIII